MKKLLTFILLTSSPLFACVVNEALVAGTIGEIEIIEKGKCRVSVNQFTFYSEHALCPLLESTVLIEGVILYGRDCEQGYRNQLSGVLQDNGLIITLDG